MHVLLGAKLQDIGGQVKYTGKPYWPRHFVGDVEAKLCHGRPC